MPEIQDDAGDIKEIRLQSTHYESGWQDEVRVIMADLYFTATISSGRDVRLAYRLGKAHGIDVFDCRQP